MVKILSFFDVIFFIIWAALLIFIPKPFMKFMGNIYWYMGKFTALGKTENTKKYFLGENTFWFRTLGVIMLFVGFASIYARLTS